MPVISANRSPSTFLNMRFGIRVAKLGSPVPRVHVQEAVVVEVAEVAPHRGEDHVEAGFLGHVLEALAVQVTEEPVGITGVRLAQQALDHIRERAVVAGGEDVEPAVVVIVPGPAREAVRGPVDAHLRQ